MKQILVKSIVLLLFFSKCEVLLAAEENAPDLGFIEFLGEWQAEDGGWLDPFLLLDIELAQRDEMAPGVENDEN